MRGLAPPFGRHSGGTAAAWPRTVSRGRSSSRAAPPADPWFDPPRCVDGETVLADLDTAETPEDATRVLLRYFVVRLLRSAVEPSPGFIPAVERAAARSLLQSLPPDDPDRLVLSPFVEGPVRDLLGDRFADRVEAVAASPGRHLGNSTFALLLAGHDLASASRRYGEAAHIARLLAAFVAARDASRAARRWGSRARANERRAAGRRKPG